MKFSYCSIAFRNQKITVREILHTISQAGYDGVEFWGNHVNNGTDLNAVKELLDEYSLSVPMVSPYFDLTGNSQALEKSLETAGHFIEIAAFLQAPLIRAFTGTVGTEEATDDQRANCVKALKNICKMAAEQNINVALETHPSTLVDNVEDTLTLIEQVNMENLKVNLDIYHMFEVHRDPLMVLNALLPYVAHVHAKNAILSVEERDQAEHPLLHDPKPKAIFIGVQPLADGEMDYQPFIHQLTENNFDGFVSVEWFGDNPEEAAFSELKYLQSVCQSKPAPVILSVSEESDEVILGR